MPDKVMFTRAVDLVPARKGLYKDPMKDFNGFRLLVWPEAKSIPTCEKENCDGCLMSFKCPLYDSTTKSRKSQEEVEKACGKPRRRRKWGEDDEYDTVMRNFGMTPGKPGEEIEQQLVFGWANVTLQEDGTAPFDWQGDTIPTEVLESAAYNFVMAHGLANQEHEWGTECGWLVESMMFTKEKMAAMGIPEGTLPEGWFVGFYVPDPDVYAKVKNGEYNMFSIEGYGRRVPLDAAGNPVEPEPSVP